MLIFASSKQSTVVHSVAIDDSPRRPRKDSILTADIHPKTMCSRSAVGYRVISEADLKASTSGYPYCEKCAW